MVWVLKERKILCVSPAGQASVFKGVGRRREEVRGAEEVAEDESTAVELPVDQVGTLIFTHTPPTSITTRSTSKTLML